MSSVDIDRGSDLWKTCVHEAGHVIIREKYGFVVTKITIKGPNRGWVDFDAPRRLMHKGDFKSKEVWRYHGVACLAGFAAAEKLQWFFPPGGCETDEERAEYAAEMGGVSVSTIRRVARSDISRNWKHVQAQAEKIYQGAIASGIKKNSWW